MRRLHELGTYLAVSTAAWVALLVKNDELFNTSTTHLSVMIRILPLYLVVAFALYSAAKIGWSLVCFPTCPKAAEKLRKDMKRTQREFVKLGVFTKQEVEKLTK